MMLNKKLFLTLLIIFAAYSFSLASSYENPFVQRVEGKFLREAGVTRLDEIFKFANGWGFSSIDAYTVWSSPGLLSGYDQQDWVLMVDDHLVDLEIFDNINLNYLGISPDDIKYVEFSTSPDIVNGMFTDRGLVHIHTYKPADFPAANSSSQSRKHYIRANLGYMGGNETGEPGLYKYTDDASVNVDRIGADYRAGLFVKTLINIPKIPEINVENLAMGIKTQNPFVNDTYISRRYRMSIGNKDPRAHHKNYYYRGDLSFDLTKNLKGKSSFFYNASENEEFLLFKPIGRELPSRYDSRNYSFTQKLNFSPNFGLKYYSMFSGNFTDPWYREGGLISYFDYRMQHEFYNIESFVKAKNHLLKFGYSRDYRKNNTNQFDYFITGLSDFHFDDNNVLDNFYFSLSGNTKSIFSKQVFNNIEHKFNFLIGQTDSQNIFKSSFLISKPLPHFILAINAGYLQHHPYEDNPNWIWHERGYYPDFSLGNYWLIYDIPDEIKNSECTSIDLIFKNLKDKSYISILDDYEIQFSYKNFRNQWLRNFEYKFADYIDSSFIVYDPRFINYSSGEVLGISAKFVKKNIFTDKLSLNIFANYQETISGDSLFELIRDEIFPYTVRSYLTFKPEPNLTLTAIYSHYGATEWERYRILDTSDTPYDKKLKSIKTFDVSVQKYFIKRRMMVNAQLRNIFNHVQRYHPTGGRIYDRSLIFHISLFLDKSFGK